MDKPASVLATAANAFDHAIKRRVLAIDWIVRITQVLFVGHLIGPRLAVADRCLLGAGLGPFLVGFLNERLFGGGATLGVCLAIVRVASATIATFLFARSWFAFTCQSIVAKPTEIIAFGVRQG